MSGDVPITCPHCGRVTILSSAAQGAQYCSGCGMDLSAHLAPGAALQAGALTPVPATGAAPLLYGRYLLQGELGRGGFGAVYRAVDTRLNNRTVAIKQTLLQGEDPEALKEAMLSFTHEMEFLAGLSHPNLPAIYDWFTDSTHSVLVMEYIEGETLEQYMHRRNAPLDPREAATLGKALAEVLAYLHSQLPAIIFRDLKPANVMLKRQGKGRRPYLIDFGIARLFKPGQARDTKAFGSQGYAAPEQYGRLQSNERTDLYGLGATLYYLLSLDDPSDHPFIFPPFDPALAVPEALQRLVTQLTSFDQAARPASAQEVVDVLEAFLSGAPLPAPASRAYAPAIPAITDRAVHVCLLSASLVAQQDGRSSTKLADARLMEGLADSLQRSPWARYGRQLKVFYELHGGQVILDTISRNISDASCVFVLASPDLLSSRAIKYALNLAFHRQMTEGLPIFVVPLMACAWQGFHPGIELCPTLPFNGRAVADFKTKDEGYQAVLDDFLQALGITAHPTPVP